MAQPVETTEIGYRPHYSWRMGRFGESEGIVHACSNLGNRIDARAPSRPQQYWDVEALSNDCHCDRACCAADEGRDQSIQSRCRWKMPVPTRACNWSESTIRSPHRSI